MRTAAYGIGGSVFAMGSIDALGGAAIIQYGALAILGGMVLYLLRYAVPAILKSQREERETFLESQREERERFLTAQERSRHDFCEALAGGLEVDRLHGNSHIWGQATGRPIAETPFCAPTRATDLPWLFLLACGREAATGLQGGCASLPLPGHNPQARPTSPPDWLLECGPNYGMTYTDLLRCWCGYSPE